ncbi:MAG: hypothetical protein RR332_01925, partial [Clostridiales bacterium]
MKMKNNGKKWLLVAVLALSMAILVACTGYSAAGTGDAANEEELPTLTVGRPGLDLKIACIILASELGYYPEEGVNVEFETISNLADGLTA